MVGKAGKAARLSMKHLVLACALAMPALPVHAQANPRVVATIKPLHSLVAAVMEGTGQPVLLVAGRASPHTFQMKPSQMQALQDADVVFMIGAGLEPFMDRAAAVLPRGVRRVVMSEQEGIQLLPMRRGGEFEVHDHESEMANMPSLQGAPEWHGRLDADARHALFDHTPATARDYTQGSEGMAVARDYTTAPGMVQPGDYTQGGARAPDYPQHIPPPLTSAELEPTPPDEEIDMGGHEYAEDWLPDPHIWLDPMNAAGMLDIIAHTLAQAYPQHAARYHENAETIKARIMALDAELRSRMQKLEDRRFIVFHDAYQYFENAFGLQASGSITLSPELAPGARHLARLREMAREGGVT